MLRKTLLKANSSLKRSSKPLSGTSVLKRGKSLKKASQTYVDNTEERKQEGLKMLELFDVHWNTHPDKKCEACNKQLYGDNNTMYHDHLLEKGIEKFKYLKFNIENLFLVCPDCHTAKTSGYPLPKHALAIEEILQKHLNGELC